MPIYNVTILRFRKPACVNAEEPVTRRALHSLGFTQVENIRMGGCFVLTITSAENQDAAIALARDACKKILVNDVMDTYEIDKVAKVAS